MKTVAEMSEREQIERLIRQRNELWERIHTFSFELASKHKDEEMSERIWDHCEKIVGNTYVVEGRNHATGDVSLHEHEVVGAFISYFHDPVDPWLR